MKSDLRKRAFQRDRRPFRESFLTRLADARNHADIARDRAGAIKAAGSPSSAIRQRRLYDSYRPLRKVLSQVNLLGKVTAPGQFVFILNAIRQAVEEEQPPLG
jgi:hypothetical protein